MCTHYGVIHIYIYIHYIHIDAYIYIYIHMIYVLMFLPEVCGLTIPGCLPVPL